MNAMPLPDRSPASPVGWWRSFHPNPARWTIGVTLGITFIVASLLRSPLLFLMESTCLAIIGVALVLRRLGLAAVQCELLVPPRVTEGETVNWVLRLYHGGRLPVFSLRARLELGEWIAPVAAQRSAADAVIMSVEAGAHHPGIVAGVLLPGERLEYRGRLRFLLRGRHSAGPVVLACEDPLGLWQVRSARMCATTTIVLPRRIPLTEPARYFSALAQSPAAPGAALIAEGGEFRGTRDYTPGDPLRRIHWKWTAHTNAYRVVEFEDENGGGVTLLLDLDPRVHVGRGRESTLEYAVRIVASLAEHFALRGRKVALVLAEEEDISVHALDGVNGLQELLTRLALIGATSALDVGEVVEQAATRLSRTMPLLIVSPASPARLQAVQSQQARRGRAVTLLTLAAESFAGRSRAGFEPVDRGAVTMARVPGRISAGCDLRRQLENLL